jgi:hypothetical protein
MSAKARLRFGAAPELVLQTLTSGQTNLELAASMLRIIFALGSTMTTFEKLCVETAIVSFLGLIGATLMLFVS